MDEQEYKESLESETLEIIANGLRAHEIDSSRAATIASYVLEALRPHMTIEQINTVAGGFDEVFPELLPIAVKVAGSQEDNIRIAVGSKIEELINQGKIEEAITLANEALAK